MPRIAAVVALLIAVTLSIGFNISHYPAVWQMLEPSVTASPADVAVRADEPVAVKSGRVDSMPAAEETAASPIQEDPVDKSREDREAGHPAPSEAKSTSNEPPPKTAKTGFGKKPEPIPVCGVDEPGASPHSTDAPEGYRIECTGDSCKLVQDDSGKKENAPAENAAVESPDVVDVAGPAAAVPGAKYASESPPAETPEPSSKKPLVPLKPLQEVAASDPAPAGAAAPAAVAASDGKDSKVRHLPPLDQEWTPPESKDGLVNGPIPLYATTRTQ